MITHDLKTWPAPFSAVLRGAKTYEIRVNDRNFAVEDRLLLREWDPSPDPNATPRTDYERTWGIPIGYTGRSLLVEVTYITPGGAWGLPANLCVMAIRRVEQGA